jgi:hypothetical protein
MLDGKHRDTFADRKYFPSWRNATTASTLVNGGSGFRFSKQFTVEVQSFLESPVGISGDALLELSVLRRLPVTDLVVIVPIVRTLLAPFVVPAVECFACLYVNCFELRLPLPTTNDGVHVERIKF